MQNIKRLKITIPLWFPLFTNSYTCINFENNNVVACVTCNKCKIKSCVRISVSLNMIQNTKIFVNCLCLIRMCYLCAFLKICKCSITITRGLLIYFISKKQKRLWSLYENENDKTSKDMSCHSLIMTFFDMLILSQKMIT